MNAIEIHAQIARERIDRDIADARLARLARRPGTSVRESVGHRLIRVGAWLAAEPTLESARSR